MSPALIVEQCVREAEWDAYVEQHPDATADHLWRWRSVFAAVFGHDAVYLIAKRGDVVSGVLPLVRFRSRLFGRFVVSVPFLNYGGLLTSDRESHAALLNAARQSAEEFGASHIELRHTARQCPDLPARQHKLALVLPLPRTVEALWSSIDKKIRNQVRKAEKEQLVGTSGGRELVDEFYDVFAHNMRDLGTPVYSRALFAQALALFPERTRIFVIRLNDKPIAAALTLRFRDTVLVPWASSLRDFRPLCPNVLLYWKMLEYSVASGAGKFDFGRSSPGTGTHQFKRQWGAQETALHWEYVLLTRDSPPDQGPSNPRFERVIEAWKRLPLWAAKLLGPRIVRSIP